jgi:signal transduction histidine kinase
VLTKEEDSLFFKQPDFKRLMHEGSVKNVEMLFRTKGGERIPMLLSGSVMRDHQGKLLGLVLIAKDITGLKQVERMKDEFLGTVSHELRTPLAIIKASIGNLKDGIVGPVTALQAEVIEATDRNCARLCRLIEDLLDLSRFESAQRKIHETRFSLSTLIHETVGSFRVSINGGKELVEEVPENLPDPYADRELTARVLTNLLQNAVHFAKEKIVVKVSMREEKSEVIVSVIDDGCGIPKEEQKELFNKFVQLHRPEGGDGYKGTGLGLAMCKNIAERQGGKVWVESDAGQGATFSWTIKTKEGCHE